MRHSQETKAGHVVHALKTKAARLESVNDQLITELQYVNHLLCMVGFEDGLESLKSAASELIEEASLDFGT